jgi:hypothetical protein
MTLGQGIFDSVVAICITIIVLLVLGLRITYTEKK